MTEEKIYENRGSAEPTHAEDIASFLHIILCVILSLKWQRSQNWGRHERRAEGVGKSRTE